MPTYEIVRFHANGGSSTGEDRDGGELPRGLTLEEAQEHCKNPETSSKTCSDPSYKIKHGEWFDGYREE